LMVQELHPETIAVILKACPEYDFVKPSVKGGKGSEKGWTHEGNIFWKRGIFSIGEKALFGAEDINQEEKDRRLFWVNLVHTSSKRSALFATAHFTWQGQARECATDVNLRKDQARRTAQVLRDLDAKWEFDAIIFGGDLNESFWPKRVLESAGFVDCFSALHLPCRPTHPTRPSVAHEERNADSALDWLFSMRARPILANVIKDMAGLSSEDKDERHALAIQPSDHMPVMAVYRY